MTQGPVFNKNFFKTKYKKFLIKQSFSTSNKNLLKKTFWKLFWLEKIFNQLASENLFRLEIHIFLLKIFWVDFSTRNLHFASKNVPESNQLRGSAFEVQIML